MSRPAHGQRSTHAAIRATSEREVDDRTILIALSAAQLLADIEGIAFCPFTDVDVVRHPLVQKIVLAYEARDAKAPRVGPGEKR